MLPRTFAGRALLAVRFFFGGASWLAPAPTLKAAGLDARNGELVYLGRLFGGRDAILGLGLMSTTGDARRLWWKLGICCDVNDLLAGVAAGAAGLPIGRNRRIGLIVSAILGVTLGVTALRQGDV